MLRLRIQELCESRGGHSGLPVLMSLTVSVDVKQHWTMLTHWSQVVPNMSTDIRGHSALHHHRCYSDWSMMLLNVRQKTGLLLTIDYCQVFDRISKDFMIRTFKTFGFGLDFVRCVSVLIADAKSCVAYCGWLSEYFAIEAGIRQGCPFSPLFLQESYDTVRT